MMSNENDLVDAGIRAALACRTGSYRSSINEIMEAASTPREAIVAVLSMCIHLEGMRVPTREAYYGVLENLSET
jgi:hypothetical protein